MGERLSGPEIADPAHDESEQMTVEPVAADLMPDIFGNGPHRHPDTTAPSGVVDSIRPSNGRNRPEMLGDVIGWDEVASMVAARRAAQESADLSRYARTRSRNLRFASDDEA